MIKQRIFGSDTPFMTWLRRQEEELPSKSVECGIVASDSDVYLHRYLTSIDGIGTREIQALMFLEVKTRNLNSLPYSQRDTLAKMHVCCARPQLVDFCGQKLRHFGVSFLWLSGDDPDNSERMLWGRFNETRLPIIMRVQIVKEQLFKLLRFELHPDNLTPRPFRRHHKTRQFIQSVKTDLGFEVDEIVTQKS